MRVANTHHLIIDTSLLRLRRNTIQLGFDSVANEARYFRFQLAPPNPKPCGIRLYAGVPEAILVRTQRCRVMRDKPVLWAIVPALALLVRVSGEGREANRLSNSYLRMASRTRSACSFCASRSSPTTKLLPVMGFRHASPGALPCSSSLNKSLTEGTTSTFSPGPTSITVIAPSG
jgi:hypothetical protein